MRLIGGGAPSERRKRKLLFVMPDLSAGGGEKSLVNLLSQLDYEAYEVDLLLFSRTGVLLQSVPEGVRVLELPELHAIFSEKLPQAIRKLVQRGSVRLAYSRIMFTVLGRTVRETAVSEQVRWRYYREAFDPLGEEYDAAIGYLEKSSIYYVVEKVRARRKIGWIHTNYSSSGMKQQFDRPYFARLDHLVTVSEECASSLIRHFPQLQHKIRIVYNIVSPRRIRQLAEVGGGSPPEMAAAEPNALKLVTLARLSREKGIDLAVEACRQLTAEGISVCWYVLGEGDERERLERLIRSYGLEGRFLLLGTRENPYPYLKAADLYVQPSRYEGKSLAIDEAKILAKPIVVTAFDTAPDQIADGEDGLIVELSGSGLRLGIERLAREPELRSRLVRRLMQQQLGTEREIEKLYEIIR